MTKFLLLPVLAAAVLSAPAMANNQPASRHLSISAAELTTLEGAAAVHARISNAAMAACRDENRGGVAFQRSVRLCTEGTIARTVAQLDSPLLTAHHSEERSPVHLASTRRQSAS